MLIGSATMFADGVNAIGQKIIWTPVTVNGFMYEIHINPPDISDAKLVGITNEKMKETQTTHVLEIPTTIEYEDNDYNVFWISENFLEGHDTNGIKKVILPDKPLNVMEFNFCDMPDLEEIVYDGTWLLCNHNNFVNLPKLKSFVFPKNNRLGDHTFVNVGIERIKFQQGGYTDFSDATLKQYYGNFWNLPNLIEIDLADVDKIQPNIFKDLPKLRELIFNASLNSMGHDCFQNMESLQKIIFKKRDNEFVISRYCFENTPELTDIYVENEIPFSFRYSREEKGFYPPRYTLHVPVGSKALYEAASGWSAFGRIVEDGAGVDETAAENATWRCAAVSGGVAVVGAEGLELRIFAIDGKLVERLTPTADCTTVPLPAGLYIVSAAGRSIKICVR